MHGFQAMRATIREELKADYPLPPFLDQTVDLFRKVHIYYRTYKYTLMHEKASKNKSKGHPAVYGAALHLVGDYTSIGSYALQVALVTKCTQDLLQEYRQLSESYQKFRHTVKKQYPIYQHVEWKKEKIVSKATLSPSLYLTLRVRIIGVMRQMLKITRCTLEIFKQMFKLSMCLGDACLLFNKDPQMRYEACTELVAKWDQYQNQLKDDKKLLAEELEKSSELADHILKKMGVKKDSTFIIDELKKTMESLSEESDGLLDDIYAVAEETLDTFYVKGKITPLHIDLALGKLAPPALPYGRFPPWAGQKVVLDTPARTKHSKKPKENMLNQIIPAITKHPMKGMTYLADCVNQFYQTQFKETEGISPFA